MRMGIQYNNYIPNIVPYLNASYRGTKRDIISKLGEERGKGPVVSGDLKLVNNHSQFSGVSS